MRYFHFSPAAAGMLLLFLRIPPASAQTASDPLLHVADSLYGDRVYPAAADAYETAERAARDAGDRLAEARALRGRGATYTLLGRVEQSFDPLRKALAIAESEGDSVLQVRVLQSIGISRHDLGRHPAALLAYERALSLAGALGDPALEGPLWNNVASVRYRLGEYSATIEALERARALLPPDSRSYGRVLANIGRAHVLLGEYGDALPMYEAARDLALRHGDRHLQGIVHDRMANLHERTGQNDRAIEENLAALEIARSIGLRQGESATLENLGRLKRKAGDLEGALADLQAARAIQEADGDDTGLGTTLALLAEVHSARGDLAGARRMYALAIEIDRAAGQRVQEATSRLGLSAMLLDAGETSEALAQADTALTHARAAGQADLAAQARWRRALALRASGRPDAALAELRRATATIESLRTTLTTDPAKIGFLEERQRPFHELVDLLLERGRAEEALEVAERARARALVDLLARRVNPTAGRAGAALARVRSAEAETRRVSLAPSSGEGADLLALRTGREIDEALAALVAEDEDLASLVAVRSASAEEIQSLASAEDATILEYLVTDDALYAWVVSPDGAVRARREPFGRDSLAASVERIRSTWEAGLAQGLPPASAADAELALLHRRLVAPLAGWLPDDPDRLVYVVPHDALFLLPFAALRDAAGRRLIERHQIASIPSASVLALLAERRAARGPGSERRIAWLGVGDPVPPPDSGLERLPWAEGEVRRIAGRFPDGSLLLGEAATEAAFRRATSRSAILHFAGHGVISDEEPLGSALVLAAGEGEDGWLRTPEVFALDLAADLVVLSGCSTGLGRLTGDGIVGLARGFLFAGASTLLVSQWDVSDRATAELMEVFYEGLDRGLPPARALREARLVLLERYHHPFLWAAFDLIGLAG